MTDLLEIPEFLKRKIGEKPTNPKTLPYWHGNENKMVEPAAEVSPPKPRKKVLSIEAQNKLAAWSLASEIEDIIFNTLAGNDDIANIGSRIQFLGMKPKVIRIAYLKVEALVKEINLIGSDSDVSEAYDFLPTKKVDELKKLGRDALLQMRAQIQGKKAARSQVEKKSRRVEKVVGAVKFQTTDTEFGLTSLDPAKVLDTRKLVVYDTKRRQLGLYVAKDGMTLSFKGTTLQNFDEEKSFVKRLRDPGQHLAQVIDASEQRIDKIFESINSKAQTVNGRTRTEVMFLNVFK